MITVELARSLLAGGLVWEPAPGDRFVVPDRDMDDEVFVVSQMVVDVHEFPAGRVIGFNGTTEWALDSLELTEVLWLPGETRLREELGDRFGGLRRAGDDWLVTVLPRLRGPDDRFDAAADLSQATDHRDPDPECAYALAVLEVLDF
ncbi:MAG: pilus assembly protein CpaE [Actinomycetota bacterium]|nr:pilus assembly protein CpaE [Actinomycetota bacterium]